MNKSNVDLGLSVGFGLMAGSRAVFGIGNNPDIDVAPEDIWVGGGIYPWMSAATSLEIVSSSVNDTAAGTGARTVLIRGLDASYNESLQAITLNGTTPVAIPTQLIRHNGTVVVTAGSSETNVGDLTIRDAGGGTTRGMVALGYGTSRQSQFTPPAGYTMQIVFILNSINRPSSVRDATVALYVKPFGGAYRLPLEITVASNAHSFELSPGPIVPEKADFGIRCTYVSATNTDITSSWAGILIKNTDLVTL